MQNKYHKIKQPVYIIKPDLDTIVTAALAGINPKTHQLVVLTSRAPAAVLENPKFLCLECGGSGQIHLNNFDHHDGTGLPSACVQALKVFMTDDLFMHRLVAYAAAIDSGVFTPKSGNITLGHVLGGLALTYTSFEHCFWAGLHVVRELVARRISPQNLGLHMHQNSLWAGYVARQKAQRVALSNCTQAVRRIAVPCGYLLALTTCYAGVHGLLLSLGGQVRLAMRHLPSGKTQATISCANDLRHILSHFLALASQHEQGWGGPDHGCIVASPYGGSCLGEEEILAIITAACYALQSAETA